MKNISKILILLAIIVFSSCSDFLEETPYNKITGGNFYTTKEGIKSGVNGVYSTLRGMYIQEYLIYMCEGPTDIWETFHGPEQFKNWSIDATNGSVNSFWNHCYRSINQCNEVLASINNNPLEDLDSDLRKRYKAEVEFIRAHYFYHLVQQFGDIPMPLTPTTTANTVAIKRKAEDVWNQIIADLENASKVLPDEYAASEYGRVTKYAALHHLARVLLTVNRSKNDLVQALLYAEEVLKNPKFKLEPSHKKLWEITNKQNGEAIFSVLYTQNDELNGSGNPSHMYFCSAYSEEHPGVKRVIEYGRPWSRLRSTFYALDLIDETKDKRFEDCFYSEWNVTENSVTEKIFSPFTKKLESKTWVKGERAMIAPKRVWTADQIKQVWPVLVFLPDYMRDGIDPSKDVQSEANPNAPWPSNTRFMSNKMYPYIVKCLDPARPEVNWTAGSRNVLVFRLADTYLLAAEAAFLTDDKSKAAKYINEVRKRAAIPGKEADMEIKESDINIDFILDERARELMGEMHRWYDLKRTGKLMERLNNKDMNSMTAGKFKDYHVLRPIPRDQMLTITNPDEFKQNPGYGN